MPEVCRLQLSTATDKCIWDNENNRDKFESASTMVILLC